MFGLAVKSFCSFVIILSIVRASPNSRDISTHIHVDKEVPAVAVRNSPKSIHVGGESSVTLNFDDIDTDGEHTWPDGYGGLEWSKDFTIYDDEISPIFPGGRATSPPNALFVNTTIKSSQASFKVSSDSPGKTFNLLGFKVLEASGTRPSTSCVVVVQGYLDKGSRPVLAWEWLPAQEFAAPADVSITGINNVTKVEIYVSPGKFPNKKERLPFTLDDIEIVWENKSDDEGSDLSVGGYASKPGQKILS